MKKYRLERRHSDDGEWYHWGTYSDISALVKAAAELGRYGYTETQIRVREVS